jgi:small subunit ribosomal protein S17e
VRSQIVKNVAKDLMARFPNKFTDDFSSNKQLVEALTNVASKKLKNRIAGYVTHLVRLAQSSEGTPTRKPWRRE